MANQVNFGINITVGKKGEFIADIKQMGDAVDTVGVRLFLHLIKLNRV